MNNIILNDNKYVKSKIELNLDNNTICLSKMDILKYFPKNKINTSRYINFISKDDELVEKLLAKQNLTATQNYLSEWKISLKQNKENLDEEYIKSIQNDLLQFEKDYLLGKKAIEQRAKKGGKNE